MIAVSIVSHGHGTMLFPLIKQILDFPEVDQILVTSNIRESLVLPDSSRTQIIENSTPKGFGANHNSAFLRCQAPYFCPLNPDVIFRDNPFAGLINVAGQTGASLIAPLIKSPDGRIEDSMRRFPTPGGLVKKLIMGSRGSYYLDSQDAVQPVEWVAGMFMLFKSSQYALLGGFDERYHLYYEDVDICIRAWRQGMQVVAAPMFSVIHDARRSSHRNLRHLSWHLHSMARYFRDHAGQLPVIKPLRRTA